LPVKRQVGVSLFVVRRCANRSLWPSASWRGDGLQRDRPQNSAWV